MILSEKYPLKRKLFKLSCTASGLSVTNMTKKNTEIGKLWGTGGRTHNPSISP